jgi:hypothetical protein
VRHVVDVHLRLTKDEAAADVQARAAPHQVRYLRTATRTSRGPYRNCWATRIRRPPSPKVDQNNYMTSGCASPPRARVVLGPVPPVDPGVETSLPTRAGDQVATA